MLTVLAAGSLSWLGMAADWHRVAYDDAGEPAQQTHLVEGSDWTFENPGEGTPAARTCVFGSRIEFGYAGLTPQASYRAKLTFFADADRTMRVKAGDATLGEMKAENGRTTSCEYAIPAAAYASGTLSLMLERLSGPNAVVSEVEILSDAPATLAAIPEPPFSLPRLSPRPKAVSGCARPKLDLGGVWRFHPAPASGFGPAARETGAGWVDIQVPGEWAMQGFEVKPGTAAGYFRTFKAPGDWTGKRIKLRCDAVYSDAVVWINGNEAGKHSGGFTPFELDVTGWVKPGADNTIAMSVLNESVADKLASGSQYACHQLGGIPRPLFLFVLPESNIASLQVTTRFDTAFRDAVLGVEIEASNDGAANAPGLYAVLSLTAPNGKLVAGFPKRVALDSLRGSASIPVARPVKWDNEHPNLYTLTVKLETDGKTRETLEQKIGFRQIEVRGNELLVNGKPVKLRGSNHHEVYPVTGRAVPAGIHRRDIELFREANVNHLRTCHYPPSEDLMTAADELGMFIECEAPFCWAPGDGHRALVCQQTAEMVLTYRNHPSVLFWSLANESAWGRHFVASSKLVRQLDPTRPQTFNNPGDQRFTEIANLHYPGHDGPAQARRDTRHPIYQGEDCHLNAYNRLELATDPALRDTWGRYTREMWDDIYATKGSLGQSIWSGVDDTFYLKDNQTVGYGTWGPIDGWRRVKPEYWGLKKAYSPVRILNADSLVANGKTILLAVENRQNFANLNEMKISWSLGKQSGRTTADIPPGGKGNVLIRLARPPQAGERLALSVIDPRGFVADQFNLSLAGTSTQPTASSEQPRSRIPATLTESADVITVKSGPKVWQISKTTGQIVSANNLTISGPQLMLLPLSDAGETQMTGKAKVWEPLTAPCAGWVCSQVAAKAENGCVTVVAAGKYDGAEGAYTLTFGAEVRVAYRFALTKPVNPRQVGLVFTLPRACEVFSWERQGYWDVYPEDHIGRLKGIVKASEGFDATSVGPRTKPSHPWRLDRLPYGNNDFCSTKHNVLTATLADDSGKGLKIDGQGKQHVRCWRTATAACVLVADYSNGGSERFLRGFAVRDDRSLKSGDTVSGTIEFSFQSVQ